MLDPYTMLQQEHRNDLMGEAERERLLLEATVATPGLLDRALLAAGNTLINSGLHLYAWYRLRSFERDWARTRGLP